MHDTQDFDDVDRGFVARAESRNIHTADGRLAWDLDAYRFLEGPAPDTANPSLWRQGQLLIKDGLYEVVPGVYQLRGFDLSVMSVIEGETGVIVVDPLTCLENAAAAFALYTAHRGARPVKAMIYTHSHIDHFGGVKGIITQEQVDSGEVPVIAPRGSSITPSRRTCTPESRWLAARRTCTAPRSTRGRPDRSALGSARPCRAAT